MLTRGDYLRPTIGEGERDSLARPPPRYGLRIHNPTGALEEDKPVPS
jgi:hypothetical protein